MAMTKKSWQDHLSSSFGQVDEAVRSRTGNDGLIVGGIMEGTATAIEHGDFAAMHFDANQNLMVNIASGEVVASMGTVGVLEAGSVVVTAGTISDLNTIGTIGVVESGSIVVTNGTIGDLNTVGTVGVLNAGSVVVTAGTIGDLDTVGTVGVLSAGSVVVTAGTIGDLDTVGTVGVINNLVTGTIAQVTSVTNLAGGTIGIITAGTITPSTTVRTISAGSVVVTAGTIGDLDTVGTVGVINDGTVKIGGTAKVDLATLIAGEDQTNDVMKTENQFSYYHHIGTAGEVIGTVKGTAGLLHTVTVNTVGTSPLTIYDSVGTSATVIGILSGTIEQTKLYNVKCATGITVRGTSATDVTISFR